MRSAIASLRRSSGWSHFLEGSALLCLIIFFIVHFSGLKAFSTRRSTRMGANSLLMVLLFVGILAIVNFLAARHSIRWDLSENQNFSLAPQTHRVLRSLPREVTITVFTREKDPGYQSYKERLDSYRQASSKISVEFVDPERQPKIAQNYGITRTDTAVFESAGHSVRVTSPSEVELTGALIRVSQDSKKRVLFLEGHGEPSLDDRERTGLSAAREILLKQGYDVGTLSLAQRGSRAGSHRHPRRGGPPSAGDHRGARTDSRPMWRKAAISCCSSTRIRRPT